MHGTIDLEGDSRQQNARDKAHSIPLGDIDVSHPELFKTDSFWPYFDRLRKEDPVHYCKDSMFGPYWSVTKYNDIMHVDTNAAIFSSDVNLGGVMLRDVDPAYQRPSFIMMDEPHHAPQRKTVSPMFTPTHLDELAILVRERSAEVLDNLPRSHLVRFPLGRSPQADAMVRSRHGPAEKHDLRQRTAAAGRTRRGRVALNQTCQMPPTCEKGDAPMTELAAVASRSWLFP
jgi:hypothetical protein